MDHWVYVISPHIYGAPTNDMTDFNDKFIDNLNKISNKSSFVCGDFNIDLLKSDKHNPTKVFIDQLFGAGYYPLITKPTRITITSYTLIDNIYTNELCVPIDNGILVNDISDHLPIFTFINFGDCVVKTYPSFDPIAAPPPPPRY